MVCFGVPANFRWQFNNKNSAAETYSRLNHQAKLAGRQHRREHNEVGRGKNI